MDIGSARVSTELSLHETGHCVGITCVLGSVRVAEYVPTHECEWF